MHTSETCTVCWLPPSPQPAHYTPVYQMQRDTIQCTPLTQKSAHRRIDRCKCERWQRIDISPCIPAGRIGPMCERAAGRRQVRCVVRCVSYVWEQRDNPRFRLVGLSESKNRQHAIWKTVWLVRVTMKLLHVVGYGPRERMCKKLGARWCEVDECYTPVCVSEGSRTSTTPGNRPSSSWPWCQRPSCKEKRRFGGNTASTSAGYPWSSAAECNEDGKGWAGRPPPPQARRAHQATAQTWIASADYAVQVKTLAYGNQAPGERLGETRNRRRVSMIETWASRADGRGHQVRKLRYGCAPAASRGMSCRKLQGRPWTTSQGALPAPRLPCCGGSRIWDRIPERRVLWNICLQIESNLLSAMAKMAGP